MDGFKTRGKAMGASRVGKDGGRPRGAGAAARDFTEALLKYQEATLAIAREGRRMAEIGVSVARTGVSLAESARPFKAGGGR